MCGHDPITSQICPLQPRAALHPRTTGTASGTPSQWGVWWYQGQDPQEQITSDRATQVHVPLKGWLSPAYPFRNREKVSPTGSPEPSRKVSLRLGTPSAQQTGRHQSQLQLGHGWGPCCGTLPTASVTLERQGLPRCLHCMPNHCSWSAH